MLLDHAFEFLHIILIGHTLDVDHRFVDFLIKSAVKVKNISNTAAHSCCKVLSNLSQYNDTSSGHVLAAVIADTFYHCSDS